MTAPVFFFAVQFTASASAGGWCEIVPAHRNEAGSAGYKLRPGTYQVAASWDGPIAADLNVLRGGSPVRVATIDAGVGPRDSRIVTVVVPPGETAELRFWRRSDPSDTWIARGAFRIFRQPEPGEI